MVVVRRMRWWDIDAVMALERQLFEGDSWSAELFWSELAQHDITYYLVAVDGHEVVGYAGLAIHDEEGYIQTMAVAPSSQRRGLGRLLLNELMTQARQRGVAQVGLEVRSDNDPAQALYRRFGFAPVGLRRGYYQPSGADAVVMRVDVSEVTDVAVKPEVAEKTAG